MPEGKPPQALRMIVGLGNPGAKYARTRHNIGFLAVESLAAGFGWPWKFEKRWQAEVAKAPDSSLWLVKPQTFMNLCGESVGPLARFLRLAPADILAVGDDLDLPWGRLRLREKGSAGGHNGLKSLIMHLGTQEFPRMKIGVGRPDGRREVVDHVLGRFSEDEQAELANILERVTVGILAIQKQGLGVAMNAFNGKSGDSSPPPGTGAQSKVPPESQKENPAST